MPELVTEWGDHKLWPTQITAIRNLEKSLAQGRPRALIQMATGSGKTFTAISFIYRLIKYAGARRVLFLVDRGNLGRQTKKEFDQYVSPVNNFKFGEEYIVQHLSDNNLDKPARVVISTTQRMYCTKRRDVRVMEPEQSWRTISMSDSVKGLARALQQFARDREWGKFHSPKNLASALVVEARELLEHSQWLTEEQSRNLPEPSRSAVAAEAADVLLYLIQLCTALGIDPIAAAQDKLRVNAEMYPVERSRGTNKKHDQL